MSQTQESLQACLKLVETLQEKRVQCVFLDNQIKALEQKNRLLSLDLKRLEAKKVLEVEQAKQSDGRPIAHDLHVKQAMVEDLLARDKIVIALLHKIRLHIKHIQRKTRKSQLLCADVSALESKEKILLLGVR